MLESNTSIKFTTLNNEIRLPFDWDFYKCINNYIANYNQNDASYSKSGCFTSIHLSFAGNFLVTTDQLLNMIKERILAAEFQEEG